MTTAHCPKWTDLRVRGDWTGLQLDLPCDRDARMRVEVTSGRRILVLQNETPILAARVQRWMSHVDYARLNASREVVPPIRADLARHIAQSAESDRTIRWAYRFAAALAESDAGASARWPVVTAVVGAVSVAGGLSASVVA